MRDKHEGVQQDLLSASAPSNSTQSPLTQPVTAQVDAGFQSQFQVEKIGGEAFMGTCPDCGSSLEMAEGCMKCHVCGFSECG
jgi:ribonucleoside-diphosphate reductase alpha chain